MNTSSSTDTASKMNEKAIQEQVGTYATYTSKPEAVAVEPTGSNLWEIFVFDITWDWDNRRNHIGNPETVTEVSRLVTMPVMSYANPVHTSAYWYLGLDELFGFIRRGHFAPFGYLAPYGYQYGTVHDFYLRLLGVDGTVMRSIPFSRHREYHNLYDYDTGQPQDLSCPAPVTYDDLLQQYGRDESGEIVIPDDYLNMPGECEEKQQYLSRWAIATVYDPPEYASIEVVFTPTVVTEQNIIISPTSETMLSEILTPTVSELNDLTSPFAVELLSPVTGERVAGESLQLDWTVSYADTEPVRSFVYVSRDTPYPRYFRIYGPVHDPNGGPLAITGGTDTTTTVAHSELQRLNLVDPEQPSNLLVWIAVNDSAGSWATTEPIQICVASPDIPETLDC